MNKNGFPGENNYNGPDWTVHNTGPSQVDWQLIKEQQEKKKEEGFEKKVRGLSHEEISALGLKYGLKISFGNPEDGHSATQSDLKNEKKNRVKTSKYEKRVKKVITTLLAAAASVGAIGAAGAAGIALITNNFFGKQKQAETPKRDNIQEVTSDETMTTDVESSGEKEKGIIDGYGKEGLWLDGEKQRPYNFSNATKVGEEC
jgi:hypothetical protein